MPTRSRWFAAAAMEAITALLKDEDTHVRRMGVAYFRKRTGEQTDGLSIRRRQRGYTSRIR